MQVYVIQFRQWRPGSEMYENISLRLLEPNVSLMNDFIPRRHYGN